jgi:hypothetical protein
VEDEVALCTAQNLAWLVTHLAIIVVLVKKLLIIKDHPGLLLVGQNLLFLLFTAIRIDGLIAW